MGTGFGFDELRGDADAVAGAADAAFEDGADAKGLGDFGDVLFFAAEGEREDGDGGLLLGRFG